MKHLLLSFSVLICSAVVYAQPTKHAYYDALELRKYIITDTTSDQLIFDPAKKSEYDMILAKYLNPDPALDQDVNIIYTSNPFIKKYVPLKGSLRGDSLAGLFHNGGNQGPIRAKSFGSALGSMDVTSFADGLAQFLIERGKQELDAAFFRHLQKYLKDYPEFAMLFPDTKLLIDNFSSWEYSNILSTLQVAFKNDIKNLLANASKLPTLKISSCGDNKKCEQRLASLLHYLQSDEGRLFSSALVAGSGIIRHEKIPVVLSTIAAKEYLGGIGDERPGRIQEAEAEKKALDAKQAKSGLSKKEIERQQILSDTITKWSQYEKNNNNRYHNIRNAIQLLATTSNSLASTDPTRHYISETELGTLKDPTLRDLYLGLLYAELKNKKVDFYLNAQSSTKIESWTSLAKIESTTENALDYLQGVVKSNEQFEKNFANIREKMEKNETVQSEEYTALLQSTQTLLTNLSKTEEIHPDLKLPVEIKKYLDYTNLTLQIAVDLSTENYHATIINLVKLLDAMGESEEMRQFKANVVKYGSFAANVAEAKNPEDVKNAIDAIALPAGSFIIKQQTAWNIAINGYIGYSWDYLKPLQGHTLKMHGVYAPVGISFSRGLSSKGKGALTAFASLIDVGGIVSYRLSDSTNQGDIQSGDEASELKQQVRLESIFSPSAHLLISGFKIPIAVGCGWRYTPKLYYTGSAGFETIQPKHTFNVTIMLDIPLLNLRSIPYKKLATL